MSKQIIFCTILFLLLSSVGQLFCLDKSYLGDYDLFFHNNLSWQQHFIKVKKHDNGYLIGEVGIDWNIGPQARIPGPDEVLHVIPFRAKLVKEKTSFSFEINVTERTIYEFNCFFVDKSDKLHIVGYVVIKPDVITKTTEKYIETVGILATQKENNKNY